MATIVIAQDGPDAITLRQQLLQPHFDYIESILDKVSVAGPMYDNPNDSNKQLCASCFIYATDNLEQARDLFLNDPYQQGGVYSGYTINGLNPAAGTWIGGKIW